MFVRIDHDRVRFSHPSKGPLGNFSKIICEHEIAAVRRVRMDSESVFFAKRKNFREWIHRSRCRCTHCCDNRPHITTLRALRKSAGIHPPARIAGHRFELQLQHAADAFVRVVRLFAGQNLFFRMQLSRDP